MNSHLHERKQLWLIAVTHGMAQYYFIGDHLAIHHNGKRLVHRIKAPLCL